MTAETKRLHEVAAAYGADPARWPPRERVRLEALAAKRPADLADAQAIDRVLAGASTPAVPQAGAARIAARLPSKREIVGFRPRRPAWRNSWAIASALAASLAFGVYLGTFSETDLLFDPGLASSDDPVDLAGLGDVTDLLGDG